MAITLIVTPHQPCVVIGTGRVVMVLLIIITVKRRNRLRVVGKIASKVDQMEYMEMSNTQITVEGKKFPQHLRACLKNHSQFHKRPYDLICAGTNLRSACTV